MVQANAVDGSRLLKAVQAVAISPGGAKAAVAKFKAQVHKEHPGAHDRRVQELVADKIIRRYVRLSAGSGGVSALPGIIPGLGTLASLGTALGDAVFCMKFQVDMCMCLTENFGYDLNKDESRLLAFLVAVGGALEKVSGETITQLGTRAAVRIVRGYLKTLAFDVLEGLFRKLGIAFSRRLFEKVIPFGIGVVVAASGNYALTKYLGLQAKRWFLYDRDEPKD